MRRGANMMDWMRAATLAVSIVGAGCSDDDAMLEQTGSTSSDATDGTQGTTTGTPFDPSDQGAEEWPLLGCDPLVPTVCGLPFPSNVYTVADETTPTGRRVSLDPELLPVAQSGTRPSPLPWDRGDGFSTGAGLLAHFPGVTQASLEAVAAPTLADLGRSLADDSPTVLLDAVTQQRVPHWVDLDATGSDDAQRTFMVRPAVRLQDGRRYIVAIRGLLDADGQPVAPTPAFAALRDGVESTDPAINDRRPLYANIFFNLAQASVPREDLILAWDFTTQSRENNTDWMVHMRDEALDIIEADGGIQYTITEVDESLDPDNIMASLLVSMRVPMYLDQADPGAALNFGADGLPEPSPAGGPWAEFEVRVIIPNSAADAPASLMQYGHGQLGDNGEVEAGHLRSFANEYNYIIFGVDFIGFAVSDLGFIGNFLQTGEFEKFQNFIDRQHQGMLNSLLAMRMMKTTFAADPDYGAFVDRSRSYYHGISQGGIYGGTYLALSTDVPRGVLGVMGMSYNMLLSRSRNFAPFFGLLAGSYPDARDYTLMLALAQMLWDRIEPNGYMPYIRENTLPGTMPHEVLMRSAVGDYQVTNFGAHIMAEAAGAVHLDSGVRPIFQLQSVAAPHVGSAYIEYDFGLPPDPLLNIPPAENGCANVHEEVRRLEAARQQLDVFLQEGTVQNFCPGGVCKYPEQGACP